MKEYFFNLHKDNQSPKKMVKIKLELQTVLVSRSIANDKINFEILGKRTGFPLGPITSPVA